MRIWIAASDRLLSPPTSIYLFPTADQETSVVVDGIDRGRLGGQHMRFTDHVPRFLEVAPRDREVAEAAGVRDGRREFGVVALPIGAWTIGYSISSRSPKLRGGGPFLNGVSGANGVGREEPTTPQRTTFSDRTTPGRLSNPATVCEPSWNTVEPP